MAKLSTMAADIVPLYANNFILFMIVNFTLYVECRVQCIVHALLPRYGLYTLLSDILPTLCAFAPCAATVRATGDRKPCHGRQKDSAFVSPMTRFLTARNSFYTLRNGCCQGVVDSCATTLHNFLRTVQASVDKRADECGQVCRHFSMSPTLHNALIITQFSIISTECRHYCK